MILIHGLKTKLTLIAASLVCAVLIAALVNTSEVARKVLIGNNQGSIELPHGWTTYNLKSATDIAKANSYLKSQLPGTFFAAELRLEEAQLLKSGLLLATRGNSTAKGDSILVSFSPSTRAIGLPFKTLQQTLIKQSTASQRTVDSVKEIKLRGVRVLEAHISMALTSAHEVQYLFLRPDGIYGITGLSAQQSHFADFDKIARSAVFVRSK